MPSGHPGNYTTLTDVTLKAGKRCTNPVYAYSLSWSFDDPVDRHEMERAVRETLAVLGFADRQALIVCHNDEPQPHVHVIVNRVHPETGRADHAVPAMRVEGIDFPARRRELSNDHLALSRWAEAYQKRRGQDHLTPKRTANNHAREKGSFVKDAGALSRSTYERLAGDAGALWRSKKAVLAQVQWRREAERKNLEATHTGQRAFLYDEKEAQIAAARAEIKGQFRPQWAALFRRQEKEKADHERQQRSFFFRLRPAEQRTLAQALLDVQHIKERHVLAGAMRAQRREALEGIHRRYHRGLERLEVAQQAERSTLAAAHSLESQTLARAIKDGAPLEELRKIARLDDTAAVRPREEMTAAKHPVPAPRFHRPIGTARLPERRRRLAAESERRIAEHLAVLREQARPHWAALYRRQRAEMRENHSAQRSGLARLVHHIRSRRVGDPKSLLGAALALLGSGRDQQLIGKRHAEERRALARVLRQEKDRALGYEEERRHQETAQLKAEARREQEAFRKAAEEGQLNAREPADHAGTEHTALSDEFRRRMNERLDDMRRRNERRRDRGGMDGRER